MTFWEMFWFGALTVWCILGFIGGASILYQTYRETHRNETTTSKICFYVLGVPLMLGVCTLAGLVFFLIGLNEGVVQVAAKDLAKLDWRYVVYFLPVISLGLLWIL